MSPYEPCEDSFLLQKEIAKFAKGRCLDVGTGSGIQAVEARKYSDDVTAVDIDAQVIDYCRERYGDITFILSDLFENVEGTFDLITFNAPYLPQDPEDVEDIQVYGGPDGHETTERFLIQAKGHLAKDGVILLLISSFTTPQMVELILKREGYSFEVISRQHVSFEDLLVYKIWRSNDS